MSVACREIRKQIGCMEPCHEHYVVNVRTVIEEIGSMTPQRVLGCGQACAVRHDDAKAYLVSLGRWQNGEGLSKPPDAYTRGVFALLGPQTRGRLRLVGHLIAKLRDNAYRVYTEDEEDFDRVEARIQHLDICNHNWRRNLHIVLREIGTGKRVAPWHAPNGFNTHGDRPIRVASLRGMLISAAAWVEGDIAETGKWGRVLGQRTSEKREMVVLLCRQVAEHQAQYDTQWSLPVPHV